MYTRYYLKLVCYLSWCLWRKSKIWKNISGCCNKALPWDGNKLSWDGRMICHCTSVAIIQKGKAETMQCGSFTAAKRKTLSSMTWKLEMGNQQVRNFIHSYQESQCLLNCLELLTTSHFRRTMLLLEKFLSFPFLSTTHVLRKYGSRWNRWEGGGPGEQQRRLSIVKPRWCGSRKKWMTNIFDSRILWKMAISSTESKHRSV